MECGACSFSFGCVALLCGNGMVLSPKTMSVSINMKSNYSLKANPCIGLDFLHSFQNCTNRLKTPSRNSRENCPPYATSIRCDNPQNTDFPRYYGKRDKKPFPVPVVEMRRAARERAKKMRGKPRTPVPPPRNGMLVKSLIPVAYNVFNNRMTMINNLKRLLKVVPVHACRWCNEVHVGPTGHPFRSCRGQKASERNGLHDWGSATVDDVFPPVECYHLYDRMAMRIPHEQRFSIPRLPALVELCIQAGVEIPEFPAKRRRKPVIRISKSEFIDADESDLPDPTPDPPPRALLAETPDFTAVAPEGKDEIALAAEEALRAWTEMRRGAKKLMMVYRVRACGYCPEVHVGSDGGHRAQNCGAYKHQQRNGQHGWQSAVLDDLVPPRYVWHVPDVAGPALQRELRSFYGQAPAVVEMCVQAGAVIPDKFKGTMRLDIGIPDDPKEAEMVV